MDPVLHLSIVVADLEESGRFYVDTLGARPGRTHESWMDVWFFGLQLTLQCQPSQALPPDRQGDRHFGVTLDAEEFQVLVARLQTAPGVTWVVPVTTDYAGTRLQQTKCKVADPSGNVVEFKTYVDPEVAFAS